MTKRFKENYTKCQRSLQFRSKQFKSRKCKNQSTKMYLNTLLLIRTLCFQIRPVIICALHTQKAVGSVANSTGQHAVPQHRIDHCAFPITSSKSKEHTSKLIFCAGVSSQALKLKSIIIFYLKSRFYLMVFFIAIFELFMIFV